MVNQDALRESLKSRLGNLRIRYPRYSLRMFAKKAGLSPATLSLLIQGKRKISKKMAISICERLQFDPMERVQTFGSPELRSGGHQSKTPREYVLLSQDQYQVIADWKAFAILNLLSIAHFKNSIKWILS